MRADEMLEPRLSDLRRLSVAEAETLQARLAGLVERSDRLPRTIGRVAGADVAYETGGDRLFAAECEAKGSVMIY
jgi:deoxyinosine 3'endonuclease (endonuclease V)